MASGDLRKNEGTTRGEKKRYNCRPTLDACGLHARDAAGKRAGRFLKKKSVAGSKVDSRKGEGDGRRWAARTGGG